MAQNNESIQELQMQLSTQKASEQEAKLSLIKQLEEQNRQLNLANQNLQHQIEAHWKQLKSAPLKTPHLQELTTEMLRLKEREETLTGQLISTHPLVAELRSKPRFLQPEDFVRIATLVNKIYPHFIERLTEAFPNLTELDQQLLQGFTERGRRYTGKSECTFRLCQQSIRIHPCPRTVH